MSNIFFLEKGLSGDKVFNIFRRYSQSLFFIYFWHIWLIHIFLWNDCLKDFLYYQWWFFYLNFIAVKLAQDLALVDFLWLHWSCCQQCSCFISICVLFVDLSRIKVLLLVENQGLEKLCQLSMLWDILPWWAGPRQKHRLKKECWLLIPLWR